LIAGQTTRFAIPASGPGRVTRADLVAVRHRGTLVSIDSRVANRLVGRAFALGRLRGFGAGRWLSEPRLGHHRLDFGRRDADGAFTHLVELKSSNLAVGPTAMFPDAPTVRGTAHLGLLRAMARRGVHCGLLMMIQRDDVDEFAPNAALDPEFTRALERAAAAGVRLEARTMVVEATGVRWGRQVPVRLPGVTALGFYSWPRFPGGPNSSLPLPPLRPCPSDLSNG
jgi:sugar fermentation stimulation protein A